MAWWDSDSAMKRCPCSWLTATRSSGSSRFATRRRERHRPLTEVRALIQDPAYYWYLDSYTAEPAAKIWNALDAFTTCHDMRLVKEENNR